MKGVILAGGHGTRLRPATEVTNKHLLPIYVNGKGAFPMLHFPIQTLKNSGVKEILIISSQDHSGAIIEHFGDGRKHGVDLTYKVQDMFPEDGVTGIAQALKLAEGFVGSSNFATILGDNWFEDTFEKEFKDFDNSPTILDHQFAPAAIFLKEVHDPQRFGVATLGENSKVLEIIEKPENPKTNFAVVGLYLYSSNVFSILPKLKPSRRKELEVTDVNNHYVKNGTMRSYILHGKWKDAGTPESMLETIKYVNGE